MLEDLKGKRALITGSSTGIGAAVAQLTDALTDRADIVLRDPIEFVGLLRSLV